MKRKFNFLLMAALVCGMGVGITSCSDSDDKNNVSPLVPTTLDLGDLPTHGIETDMESAIIKVPIKAKGDGFWTATLTENADWCKILDWQVTYEGDQELTLAVDENLTKAGRNCELVIGDGERKYTHIKVYQSYTYNGEDPSNGSGLAFAEKGVGTSINYNYLMDVKSKEGTNEKFDPTMVHGTNNIFNITRIENLKREKKLSDLAYVEAEIPIADLQEELIDSCVIQSKKIKASLELSVSFGIIEFSAKAGYESEKKEGKAHFDYTIIRVAPMYNVYLSPAELNAYQEKFRQYDKEAITLARKRLDQLIETYKEDNQWDIEFGEDLVLNAQGLTAEQSAEVLRMRHNITKNFDFAGIYSSGFGKHYNNLYREIVTAKENGEEVDSAALKLILKQFDDEFGPFYIAGANYGGMLAMHAQIDTLRQEGWAKFIGEIGGEGMGLFKVSGHFEYADSGFNVMHNIRPRIYIVGGAANDVADELNNILTSGTPNDFQKWQVALRDWFSSMRSPSDPNATNQSKAAPISYIIQPTWNLFSEPEIQQTVKNFFMKEYAGRHIEKYEEILNGGVVPKPDQLLNAQSDFWKETIKK